jgi:hypothetical protein
MPEGPAADPVRVPGHDAALFEALREACLVRWPELRVARMFGSPALFAGRRMALCVHGSQIGMRVPEPLARRLRDEGVAVDFRPHGRPAMREWVALDGGLAAVDAHGDLFEAAVRFARENDAMRRGQ